MKMRVAVVTACGAKKEQYPCEAYRLYKSPRIKAVYGRRDDNDMFILSAEHGLLESDKVTAPYQRVMTLDRALELAPKVAGKLSQYDCIIFFKAGARSEYLTCMHEACKMAKKILTAFGYGFMGGINDLPKIIELSKRGDFEAISKLHGVEIYRFDRL